MHAKCRSGMRPICNMHLPSFPGSCAWAEKKSLVHTICAWSVRPGFLGIWKLLQNVLSYTNLCEAFRLLLYERCLPLTMLCVDNDKEVTKVLSSLLAEIVHAFIHSSLKFTDRLERSNADCYRQSDIFSDFSTARMCLTGSIAIQYGLQQVNRNWQ